jgi:hypothetical protein
MLVTGRDVASNGVSAIFQYKLLIGHGEGHHLIGTIVV